MTNFGDLFGPWFWGKIMTVMLAFLGWDIVKGTLALLFAMVIIVAVKGLFDRFAH